MQRDHFTLDVRDIAWVDEGGEPRRPTVVIDFLGSAELLRQRLAGADGEFLEAGQTDVAYRLLSGLEGEDAEGVVSVTNRITGDFVLELNEDAEDVLQFIRAARRYGEHAGDDGEYRVVVRIEGEEVVTYDKTTFLVYNRDGELLRQHSLIPSGVEL